MGVNEGPRNRSLLLLATLRGSGVVWRPAVAQARLWPGGYDSTPSSTQNPGIKLIM